MIAASVVGTGNGTRNEVRVEGSVDSLTHLVDRLTAEVLAVGSVAARELRGRLAGVPLAAVRAWLDGQTAFRRTRYTDAVGHYAAALRSDSTFIPAVISGSVAVSWSQGAQGSAEILTALLNAWRRRSELGTRDRILLTTLVSGAAFALPAGSVDLRAVWQVVRDSAAMVAYDNADLLYLVADEQFHFGPVRQPVSGAMAAADADFSRILALDSSYAGAYEHLVDLALLNGDTARARAHATRYFALDSIAEHTDYIRWRLAAVDQNAPLRDSLRDRIGSMSFNNLGAIAGHGLALGLDARDVLAAAEAMERSASNPVEQQMAMFKRSGILVQRGQIDAALAAPPFLGGILPAVAALIPSGVLAFENEPAARRAAAATGTWLATRAGSSPAELIGRYWARCALGTWHLSQQDLDRGERALADLRRSASAAIGVAGLNTLGEPFCPALLEAWLAVQRRRPDARRLVQHADSLMFSQGFEAGVIEATVVLARLWDTLGEPTAALTAVRRVPIHPQVSLLYPLAVIAREEGRLAALAGDREGAIRAYRRYLAIRVDPVERIKPEVESVRKELARLERESASK